MAVLPTPGSPMRTGLFLVRRRQDLDDAADLLVAADDRVELARARLGGQVAAVLLEGRVGAFRVRRGDALAAADALERLQDGLAAGGVALEERLCLATDLGDAEQQVLGRDVLVAEAACLGLGALDDAPWRAGPAVSEPPWIRARRARIGGQLAAERRAGRRRAGGASRRGCRRRARRARQDVLGVEDRAVEALGGGLGGDDGLLGLLGESVELHVGSVRLRPGSAGSGWSMVSKKRAGGARASSDRSVGRTTADLDEQVAVARRP